MIHNTWQLNLWRRWTAKPRSGLPAMALTTDTSFLTAYANDFGFECVFARQVEALGQPGTCCWASLQAAIQRMFLAAAKAAQEKQISCIALTGETGGLLATLLTYLLPFLAVSPCIFRNVILLWVMLLRRELKFFCPTANEVFARNF